MLGKVSLFINAPRKLTHIRKIIKKSFKTKLFNFSEPTVLITLGENEY